MEAIHKVFVELEEIVPSLEFDTMKVEGIGMLIRGYVLCKSLTSESPLALSIYSGGKNLKFDYYLGVVSELSLYTYVWCLDR